MRFVELCGFLLLVSLIIFVYGIAIKMTLKINHTLRNTNGYDCLAMADLYIKYVSKNSPSWRGMIPNADFTYIQRYIAV